MSFGVTTDTDFLASLLARASPRCRGIARLERTSCGKLADGLRVEPAQLAQSNLAAEINRWRHELEEIIGAILCSCALPFFGQCCVMAWCSSLVSPVAHRFHAAQILGAIGRSAAAAIPALQDTLKDSDKEVRNAAKRALQSIREER
jgi:hypothetical protein